MKKIFTTLFLLVLVTLNVVVANAASSEDFSDGEIRGCTIRTTQQTVGYQNGKAITIPKDKKLEAIKEKQGKILVFYKEKKVWIHTKSVLLINVAEYIPSIDINLAMAKKHNFFSMANEEIDGLSNRRFYNAKGSKNGTEAWLRYEVAKKLLKAQKVFQDKGYSIIIYDAYRPYTATMEFQKAYRSFLNTKTVSFKKWWFGALGESWFLAQKASSHNYGIAVDMSITKNGKKVKMPSKIHTLDKRSAYYFWSPANKKSSKNAKFLKEIMESVGFSYLQSEWWHFQDNTVARGNVIDIPN